ncbi:hypothetical protein JYG30_07900 [Fibrella sp. USSR17]
MSPKRLFLVDGLGAVLTSISLLAVLRPLEYLFGIPEQTLVMLSMPAILFAIYSGCCFLFVGIGWRSFLRVIAVANLLYCCVTAGLIVTCYAQLTPLGVAYFVVEIVVISVLAVIEYRASLT